MGLLDGKVALVTGATSGIGRATAQRFAREGAFVFVTGRRQAELDATVAGLGPGARGIRGDIARPDDLDEIFGQIAGHGQGLDVLFANAGGGSFATLEQVTPGHFDETFSVNVRGTVFTVQKALPLLNRGASVILAGSTAATSGTPAFGVYAASKAAIRSFARTWAGELAGRGVRVNTIVPGPTETEGLRALAPDDAQADALVKQLAAGLPLGRVARPEEIASAVLFLASDLSSFVTGSELFADGGGYLESRAAGQDLVLLDVGGYFAPALEEACARFTGRVLGVVEDTENGLRRYQQAGKLPCPVFGVARSPLKDPEDYLVGQSVVFSAEALLRGRGDILHGRPACVIGFGKIGSSVARLLHAKNVQVTIYDTDAVRMTQALAQGFRTAASTAAALAGAGVVVCATGNLALRADDFARLANGAYIASVTSADDELELAGLDGLYERSPAGDHITRYATTGRYFYVLNDGNAVNFLHGASVGTFIYLVQAEILAATAALAGGHPDPGLHECDDETRKFIAATWLQVFNGAP